MFAIYVRKNLMLIIKNIIRSEISGVTLETKEVLLIIFVIQGTKHKKEFL